MTKRKLLLAAIIAIILLALSLLFQIWSKAHRAESSSAFPARDTPPLSPKLPNQMASSNSPTKAPQVALPALKPAVPNPNAPDNSAPFSAPGAEPSDSAKNAVSSIVKAYQAYISASENGRMLTANPGDNAHTAALELARAGGVNLASIYFVPGDPKAPNPLPRTINLGGTGDDAVMNPAFANATLSIVLAANLPPNVDVSTTPVIWTRGLRADGTWAPDSPFGGKGGYIGFMDGHVEWVTSLSATDASAAFFLKDGTNTHTANISESLPPQAVVLSAEPTDTPNK